jgi:hypothetical protein
MSLREKAAELDIQPSNKEENVELFVQIAEGARTREEAHKRFVEGNMAYVVFKANAWLEVHPAFEYLRDDLIGEGFLVLTRIANRVAKIGIREENFNVQGMISTSLQRAFTRLAHREGPMIPLSPSIERDHIYETPEATDVMSDILSCCDNEREERIVTLRSQGLTDDQIAPMVGYRQGATVWSVRKQIQQRYEEHNENRTHST